MMHNDDEHAPTWLMKMNHDRIIVIELAQIISFQNKNHFQICSKALDRGGNGQGMSLIKTFWGHGPKGHEESTQQNIKTQKPQLEPILGGRFHFKCEGIFFWRFQIWGFRGDVYFCWDIRKVYVLYVGLDVFKVHNACTCTDYGFYWVYWGKLLGVGDKFCEWFCSWKCEWDSGMQKCLKQICEKRAGLLPKNRDKPPSSSSTYLTKNGYSKALPWLYKTPNTVGRLCRKHWFQAWCCQVLESKLTRDALSFCCYSNFWCSEVNISAHT